jgi:hypothetical protein
MTLLCVCVCVCVCVSSVSLSLHTCQSLAQSITFRPYGDPPRGNLSTAAIAALEDTRTQADTPDADTHTDTDTDKETDTQMLARSHTHMYICNQVSSLIPEP